MDGLALTDDPFGPLAPVRLADGVLAALSQAILDGRLKPGESLPSEAALAARFGVSKQRMGQIADQLKKRFRAQIIDELGPDVRTDWLGAEQD